VSPDLEPPRVGASLVKRALLGAVAIVLMSAAAVSAAGFLTVDEAINDFERERDGRKVLDIPELPRAEAGEARTIMLIGSDLRHDDKKLGIPPRADTIMLARLDPDKDAITLMSIPRDFKIEDPPWGGFSDKINAAYANGGAKMVHKTVQQLLSTDAQPFEIHHVVEVGFAGFRKGIDYLGCVYVDIDRRYFNDRGGPGGYATIDVEPGYQKLCGRDSLDYVRYRHNDNDIVRGARQQDFLRQLKDQDAVRAKLTPDNRDEILKIVARYTDPDRGFLRKKTLLSLLKLGLFVSAKPVQEVAFGDGRLQDEGGGVYITASKDAVRDTVDNFLNARTSAKPKGEIESQGDKAAPRKTRKRRNKASAIPGLEVARKEGEDQALVASTKLDFPFYFPELRLAGAQFAGTTPTRVYRLRDGTGKLHQAYRMVFAKGIQGEYYGVQAMTWKNPPILDGAHDVVERNGRKLLVYYDGKRVRLVAWRTKKAVYYVHNTLLRTIDRRRMIGIAASMRRLGQ
jgi:LCP family protein required for cell wall assembly